VGFSEKHETTGALQRLPWCPRDGAEDWEAAVDQTVKSTQVPHHEASRVLLVEDEFLLSDMIAEVLTEHGFEVYAAANAADALRHLTCGAPCDILFTDINLPGGVDGARLAELARQLRPELPVVYASGAISAIDQLTAVPGSTFVPKPYDVEKICHVLERFAAPHAAAAHH
jgi:CheY-like chemotaxis protein